MRLLLAPMEGITDYVMRDMISSLGGVDQCVTEFLRVTDKLHPNSVFYKNCPELKHGSKTKSGVPVFVQLLGGQAEPLAANAARAVELGALGVDLNFGCPAKTVNRHDGGATLLKYPERLHHIIKTVRAAVPAQVPVTVKMRLGFDNPSSCFENTKAIEEAGATWLTIHCRTKTDGYKPPAYWEWIAEIKKTSQMRIIANGEIFSYADFLRCREITSCDEFMIGRAVMQNPFIFRQIKAQQALAEGDQQKIWLEAKNLLPQFFASSTTHINDHFATTRTKQWLKWLSLKSMDARAIFDEIKILKNPREFHARLEYHCAR